MTGRRGFILIIVIGLLGVLALIAVQMAQVGRGSRELAGLSVAKAKARLLAKSGYEAVISQAMTDFGPDSSRTRLSGNSGNGFSWCATLDDTASRIDINDGIAGGLLDIGSSYDPSAIDPWRKNPASTEPSVTVIASGTLGVERPPPGAAQCRLDDGDFASVLDPGMKLIVLSGPKTGNEYNITGAASMPGGRTRLTVDPAEFTVSGYNFAWEIREQTPGDVIVDFSESAWINLRLRRLLNAYGDACKFSSEIGSPPFLDGAPNPNDGTKFTFTSTAAGRRGYPMPAVDSSGLELTDPQDIQDRSTGLGDRIIAARPSGGFKSLEQIRGIIDSWGAEHLPSGTHPDGFFESAHWDLTTRGSRDSSTVRLTRELGPYQNHAEPDYPGDFFYDPTRPTYSPVTTDTTPPDLSGLFRPHEISTINMNGASPTVRAAVFYSICNPSFGCHSAETVNIPGWGTEFLKDYRMALGVGGLVYDENRMKENGYPPNPAVDQAPANVQRNRMLSLRDSLALGLAWDHYSDTVAAHPGDFEEFRDFLKWYESSGFELERPVARGTAYDSSPTSGYFSQDCLTLSLPDLLNPVRRHPGWLGAPAALISPFYETKPPPMNEPGGMLYPSRFVEDFVFKLHLPKIDFLPGGTAFVSSHGRVATGTRLTSSRIRTMIELSDKRIFRTQADFDIIQESADSSILVGPEATGQPANPFVGFIGLKDLEDVKIGSPNIAMNFNEGTLTSGFQTDTPGTPYHDPTDPSLDPALAGPHPANPDILTSLAGSGIEDASRPTLVKGGALPGPTPFGGVRFLSFGHGPTVATDAGQGIESDVFTDTLYWSLLDRSTNVPAAVQTSFDGTLPAVSHYGRGTVNLWFQIPTGQWSAQGWDYFQKRRFFRTLFQIRLIDEIDRTSGFHQIASNITVGLTRDPDSGKIEIRGYWDEDQDAWSGHGGTGYFNFGNYPTPLMRIPNSSPGNDLFKKYLSIRNDGFRMWGRNQLTRTIVLKDIPENGPGTWHRLTVGWFRDPIRVMTGADPGDDVFWIRLRDSTRIESSSNTYAEGSVQLGFRNFSPHVWMTVGESLASVGGPVSALKPINRFNGSIDNVTVWFNDIPSTPVNYDPAYAGALYDEPANPQDPTRRYGVGAGVEPQIVLSPGVGSGDRIIHVGSRIYNPPTADNNHPSLSIGVVKGSGLDAVPISWWSPREQDAYLDTTLDDDLKVSLTWSNRAPTFDGDPSTSTLLVQDNSKVWTEIPWVKEIRVDYRATGGPKIIAWEQE